MAHTYISITCCSLAYRLAIDSASSYEILESNSQTSRRKEDDDGNDDGDNNDSTRERERNTSEFSARWTTARASESMSRDDNFIELNKFQTETQ